MIPSIKACAGAAVLAGVNGILIIALREGLTVRGYYNASAASSVTIDTGVSEWADLHTSGNDYTQATDANQPTYDAADATLRARGSITGDGTDDILECATYDAPAPGTTPSYWWAILKQVSWAGPPNFILSGDSGGTGDSVNLVQNGASPNLRLNNGVAISNAGLAVGTWGRWEAQLSNSAGDYFTLISTSTAGNAGNEAGINGRAMFGVVGSGLNSNVAIAALLSTEGTANSRFRSFANYWTTNFFGAGLV